MKKNILKISKKFQFFSLKKNYIFIENEVKISKNLNF